MKIFNRFFIIITLFIMFFSIIALPVNAANIKSKNVETKGSVLESPLISPYSSYVDYINPVTILLTDRNRDQIRYVQKMLNVIMKDKMKETNSPLLETTGLLDSRTRLWLRLFKAKYGLPVNDYFNSDTVAKLNEAYKYQKIIINTSTLNVRNAPGTSNTSVIGKVYKGEILSIYGSVWCQGNRWYKVDYNGRIGYVCGGSNISTTFIEIDITAQTLRAYVNCQLKVDTPVTTGKKWSHDTREGYFTVSEKCTNKALMGGAKSQYWLRFSGGQGIHDAKWRNSNYLFKYFGGIVYKTQGYEAGNCHTGSHGCVNTPLARMSALYYYINYGTPVYIHH